MTKHYGEKDLVDMTLTAIAEPQMKYNNENSSLLFMFHNLEVNVRDKGLAVAGDIEIEINFS